MDNDIKLPKFYLPKKLGEMVYEQIKEAILTGQIPQGSKLIEDKIAKQMGVSVTPVREALNRLFQEGLIINEAHKSASVIVLTEEDINEIFDIRLGLENLAVKRIINKITDKQMEQLKNLLHTGEKFITEGKINSYIKINSQFHLQMVTFTENLRLISFMERLNNEISLLASQTFAIRIGKYPDKSIQEHYRIVEGLMNRDAEMVVRCLHEHIENARNDLLQGYKKRVSQNKKG